MDVQRRNEGTGNNFVVSGMCVCQEAVVFSIKECIHHDQQLTYSCVFFRRLGSGIFRAVLLKISILLAFDKWLPDSRADIIFGKKFCGSRNVCSQLEVDGSTCVGCRMIMGQ